MNKKSYKPSFLSNLLMVRSAPEHNPGVYEGHVRLIVVVRPAPPFSRVVASLSPST